MKKTILILLIALFISIQGVDAQDVGSAAPAFTVDLLGGGEFSLEEQSGKVVLIFFFGNGCPFCVSSSPQVQSLYDEFMSNENFVAVGLDTWDGSSNETSVAGFKESSGLSFPLAIKAGSVSTDFGIGYDKLAVIDQDGILRHKGTAAAGNDAENVRSVINGLFGVTSAADEIARNRFASVYPNPSNDVVNFSFGEPASEQAKLFIYDIAGKERRAEMLDLNDSNGIISYDISDLKQGSYIYKLQLDEGIQTGTLIKR